MLLPAAGSLSLFLLSALLSVNAAPALGQSQNTVGARTVPLKRISLIRDGEAGLVRLATGLPLTMPVQHNLMAYQRHHNSVMRRHANMLGYEGPSDDELRKRSFERAIQIDREEGTTPHRRLFYEGALDKNTAINAAGTLEDSEFKPLGPPLEKRTFFTGALEKETLINAAGSLESSWFQPLGPPEKRDLDSRVAALTTTVSGSNKAGFGKALLAASQAAPQPVANSALALSTQGVDYAILGNDIGYLANISMGTPAQEFLMLIDTGSADTWVPSTACTACGPHKQLGAKASSSFVASNTPWQITYGSGSAAGNLCSDTVAIAGMQLSNHAFGVTTQESRQFSSADVPFDGLAGTAQSTLSNQKVLTIPESLVKTGLMTTPIISYALGRTADGVNDGELTIGGTNKALADAATSQVLNVNTTTGFWDATVASINVDGKVAVTNRIAILDTGTSLIFGPQADTDALHALIPGSQTDGRGSYTVPCTTSSIVSLTFGNVNYAIDPRDLLFLPVNSADLTGQCTSAISGANIAGPTTWLVGDAFLKNVVFETDIQARTITLAGRVPAQKSQLATKALAEEGPAGQTVRAASEQGLKGVGQVGAVGAGASANATSGAAEATGTGKVKGKGEATSSEAMQMTTMLGMASGATTGEIPGPTQGVKAAANSSAGSAWRLAAACASSWAGAVGTVVGVLSLV